MDPQQRISDFRLCKWGDLEGAPGFTFGPKGPWDGFVSGVCEDCLGWGCFVGGGGGVEVTFIYGAHPVSRVRALNEHVARCMGFVSLQLSDLRLRGGTKTRCNRLLCFVAKDKSICIFI